MTKSRRNTIKLRLMSFMLLLCCSFAISIAARGQSVANGSSEIEWTRGPFEAEIGGAARIAVPKGYAFTGQAGTKRFLELSQNPSSSADVGLLIPEQSAESTSQTWFILFQFHPVGFITDTDEAKLDPTALLATLQRNTEDENKLRKERGWPAFHVTGWETPPFYDRTSHNLTWGVLGQNDGDPTQTINYSERMLGRRGTMNVDLVLDPRDTSAVLPTFNRLLGGFSYLNGNRYSDFVKGDKLSGYGLTALIAGGAAAVATKTGILAAIWKFGATVLALLWKFIVVAFVAALSMFKKVMAMMRGLFTNKSASDSDDVMKEYRAKNE